MEKERGENRRPEQGADWQKRTTTSAGYPSTRGILRLQRHRVGRVFDDQGRGRGEGVTIGGEMEVRSSAAGHAATGASMQISGFLPRLQDLPKNHWSMGRAGPTMRPVDGFAVLAYSVHCRRASGGRCL